MAQDIPNTQKYCPQESQVNDLQYLFPADFRRRIYVLYGLAGSGKTQLAAYFARKYRNTGVFTSVIWVDAASNATLWKSLGDHVRGLWQNDACYQVRLDGATRAKLVLDWLTYNSGWVLILDGVGQDADDVVGAHQLMKCIPETHGSILITTRLANLRKFGRSQMLYGVDMDRGCRIFLTWYGCCDPKYTEEDIRELVGYFYGHPLAISEAAITLRKECYPIKFYLQLFEQGKTSPTQYQLDAVYPQGALRAVWLSVAHRIRRKNLNAFYLLLFWTCIDSHDLWFGLLSTAQGLRNKPKWLQELISDEAHFLRAMELLQEHCLVNSCPLEGYSLHATFHRWLSFAHLDPEMVHLRYLAVDVLGAAVPESVAPGFLQLGRRALRHAHSSFEWIVLDNVFPAVTTLCSIIHLGDLYLDQDCLSQAETLYVYVLQSGCNMDNSWVVQILRRLANVYARQNRKDNAVAVLKQALQICKSFCSVDDNETALDVVADLARLHVGLGRLEEALKMYSQALRGKEALLGVTHLSTLNTVNEFGTLCMARHDLKAARRYFMRALKGQETMLGSDHIFTLNTLNNLGMVYALQGQSKEAETLCRIALVGYTICLGPEHHLTVGIAENIGSFLRDQGLLDAAETMYEQALEVFQEKSGFNHTSVQRMLTNLENLRCLQANSTQVATSS